MVFDRLDMGPSTIAWDGVAIGRATLDGYFVQVRQLNPQPVTVLVLAPAVDCGRVEAVRRMMEARLQCSTEHRCVEYSAAEWDKVHTSPQAAAPVNRGTPRQPIEDRR